MILSTFFDQVNSSYRGTDDDAPAAGTPDYDVWLLTTNRKIHEYATDSNHLWQCLFDPDRTIAPVISAGLQTYNLSTDFFAPSDVIIVTTTGGQDIEYTVVAPEDRGTVFRSVYVSSDNPQTLTFYDDIVTGSEIIGGTIKVPGYYIPADLTTATDVIPVSNPYWLVYAVAAELAFNELTYESKTADLEGKANNLWNVMVAKNRRGTAGNPRKVRYQVTRIPGSNR
jgi:hypothetical protein